MYICTLPLQIMDNQLRKITLADLLNESVSKYRDLVSYSLIGGESLTYSQFGERVKTLVKILDNNGVQQKDKVALLGGSMPNWPVSYMAITSSSRIVVPILPDFTAYEIANIIDHAEVKTIIISKRLIYKLSDAIREKLELIICLDTLEVLKVPSDNNPEKLESHETTEPVSTTPPQPDDIASIIYTSGTSGSSKGVMLSHFNITSNVQMAYALYPVDEKDVFLSFLPLSHAYECTIGMLYPLAYGSSVYYLNGAPTPALLLPALKQVKPSIILSVPLIVEKIYKNKIRPIFTKNWTMQFLYSIWIIRRILHKAAGKKMLEMFGGNLRFFGIGGAKLDSAVEHFLKDAGFPYAIGYGLTECSPLIAGIAGKFPLQTTGPTLKWMEMRIADQDENGIGEVQAKGPNIMQGYFKDPARTAAAFTPDGWFKTKDLGKFDKKKYLYLKGRVDNMLIGPNGENIYPEEIEAIIRENDFVLECLVCKDGDRLVAKVYFNYEQIENIIELKYDLDSEIRKKLKEHYDQYSEKYEQMREKYGLKDGIERYYQKLENVKKELLEFINDRVNKTSKISEIQEHPVPFEKTATQKIKRYLYM